MDQHHKSRGGGEPTNQTFKAVYMNKQIKNHLNPFDDIDYAQQQGRKEIRSQRRVVCHHLNLLHKQKLA